MCRIKPEDHRALAYLFSFLTVTGAIALQLGLALRY